MTVRAEYEAFGDFRLQPCEAPTVTDRVRQRPILLMGIYMMEIQAGGVIFAAFDAPETLFTATSHVLFRSRSVTRVRATAARWASLLA